MRILACALFIVSAAFFGSVFILKCLGAFPDFTSSLEITIGGDTALHIVSWAVIMASFVATRGLNTFLDARGVIELFVMITVLPFSLEVVQLLTPSGNFSIQDGITSCLGAFIGAETGVLFVCMFRVNYEEDDDVI
jgi:hypothetical protein